MSQNSLSNLNSNIQLLSEENSSNFFSSKSLYQNCPSPCHSQSKSQEYNPVIVLPGRELKNRVPGSYPDIPTKEKAKNNISILHACKLLPAFHSKQGITALVLDGKEMRTTNTLVSLGDVLKRVNIVEYNNLTYERMLNKKREKNNEKIHCHNCHIKEYIDDLNDPKTNVVYFDIMSTLFSSEKSFGSDIIIHEFLKKSTEKQIVLAATFCLRNSAPQSYVIQQNKILLLLEKIFKINGFKAQILLSKNKLRYKGQNTGNKSMMFVLFYLTKEDEEKKIEKNSEEGGDVESENFCGNNSTSGDDGNINGINSSGIEEINEILEDEDEDDEVSGGYVGFKKEYINSILELKEDDEEESLNINKSQSENKYKIKNKNKSKINEIKSDDEIKEDE